MDDAAEHVTDVAVRPHQVLWDIRWAAQEVDARIGPALHALFDTEQDLVGRKGSDLVREDGQEQKAQQEDGADLRPLLGAGQEAVLAARIRLLWQERSARYSELRSPAQPRRRVVRMSLVGG